MIGRGSSNTLISLVYLEKLVQSAACMLESVKYSALKHIEMLPARYHFTSFKESKDKHLELINTKCFRILLFLVLWLKQHIFITPTLIVSSVSVKLMHPSHSICLSLPRSTSNCQGLYYAGARKNNEIIYTALFSIANLTTVLGL